MPDELTRRFLLQTGTLSAAAVHLGVVGNALAAAPATAHVFFSTRISAPALIELYSRINQDITGKVGIKLHTGGRHGPNILPRDLVKALQERIPNSTLVETNTFYTGDRTTTADHRETIRINGWDFCPVDILDEEGAALIPVKGGKHFTQMSVGSHLLNYDSLVVLTHFKGHANGG